MGNDWDYRKQVGINYHPMTQRPRTIQIVLSFLFLNKHNILTL